MTNLKQAGFTIVELMVAMSVLSIAIVVILSFTMNNLRTGTIGLNQTVIQAEIQRTLDSVATDVRMSANADANNRNPDNNSPIAGNEFGWASTTNTLVLANAAIDTNRNIIFSDPANYITTKNNLIYFVRDGTLYKRVLAADVANNKARTTCPKAQVTVSCPTDKVLLQHVTNFTVTYLNGASQSVAPTSARSVEITLTAANSQYRETQPASYTTRMVFRND